MNSLIEKIIKMLVLMKQIAFLQSSERNLVFIGWFFFFRRLRENRKMTSLMYQLDAKCLSENR